MALLLSAVPLLVLLFSILLLSPPCDKAVILGDFVPDEYTGKQNPLSDPKIVVEDIFFTSHGEKCHAWLYSPPPPEPKAAEEEGETTDEPPFRPRPVVIMAQGLGAQKDFGLDRYGERFVQAGYAVFMFDYRNFAASTGRPRNLISADRHIEDYHSAIEYIQSMPETLKDRVDPTKILLWGTSYSGGHVLEVASQRIHDETIRAVVSQVPHMSGRAAAVRGMKQRGFVKTLRLALALFQDLARQLLDMPPVCVAILASGDDALSMMLVSPEDHARYNAKQPKRKLGGWQNQTPVRAVLGVRRYNPMDTLKKQQEDPSLAIKVPVLFISASLDVLTPPDLIEEASKMVKNSKHIVREGSHFAIYDASNSKPVADEMVKFYDAVLASS